MLPLFHKMCYCSAIQKSRFGPAGNGNGMSWVAPDTAVFIGIRDKEVYELRIVLCVPLTEKEELEAELSSKFKPVEAPKSAELRKALRSALKKAPMVPHVGIRNRGIGAYTASSTAMP